MKQKRFVNKLSVIVIAVFVVAAVYIIFVKEQEKSVLAPVLAPMTDATSTKQAVDWESLIPDIRAVLGRTFADERIEESSVLSIFQEADVTGDGVPEALVDLGSGGAYTSYLTLMGVENGKPIAAQFKQEDGSISPLMFLEGASVMNGEAVVMIPDKNVIYAGHWSKAAIGQPFGGLSDCGVEAYQWNPQTKIFDFSAIFGNEIRSDFCQKSDSM